MKYKQILNKVARLEKLANEVADAIFEKEGTNSIAREHAIKAHEFSKWLKEHYEFAARCFNDWENEK